MSSTFGENLKLSVFGQSHGSAIGMILDGIPAGLAVDTAALQQFLNRRSPGRSPWSTSRQEEDAPEFLGGLLDGYTCGAPIAAVIRNHNTRSGDYSGLAAIPRPGHADFTAQVKFGGYQDRAGGGHFSGRLTAPLCIAGGLCKQWLEEKGIRITAHIFRIGNVSDTAFDPVSPAISSVRESFPVLDQAAGKKMQELIAALHAQGNSVGGFVECAVTGLPAGLGEPMFGGLESRLAQIIYGIPAVKSLSFGDIMDMPLPVGSEANDPFILSCGKVCTATNHAGGILGGISSGMPLLFRVGIKPTPSIAASQQTLNLSDGQACSLQIQGRHDPCIVPRAVPVVEAAAAIALFDLLLGNTQAERRKENGAF